MIYDLLTTFSENGDFSKSVGTSNVGDVVDLGAVGRDIGNGEQTYLIVVVTTAADGGATDTATVQFRLVSDAVTTPDTSTATVHFTSPAYGMAKLTAGKKFVFPVPSDNTDYERYLGLQIITAGEAEGALSCTAFLSLDPTGWQAYPDATN